MSFHYPIESLVTLPLTKKPEDSGYRVECSLIELGNAVIYASSDMMQLVPGSNVSGICNVLVF